MAMMEFLTYDLKVAVLMAVFYMFYRLLLSRETFHCVNRMVLLLMALASFLAVVRHHDTQDGSGRRRSWVGRARRTRHGDLGRRTAALVAGGAAPTIYNRCGDIAWLHGGFCREGLSPHS